MFRYKSQKLIDFIEKEVTAWQNVAAKDHERGGRVFHFGNKEIGHIHWDGTLDILFNKKIRDELLGTGEVAIHRWVPESGWTSYKVEDNEESLKHALDLLRKSYELKKEKALQAK